MFCFVGLCVLLCGAVFVGFCWVTGIPLSLHLMHKVVIHSKTVTIVMMSAAQEQKKKGCILATRMRMEGYRSTHDCRSSNTDR